jgi:hypothetical protein
MKDILTVRQPEDGHWACTSSVGINGNQSLETLLARIEKGMKSQSEKPWDYYLWKAEGKRWDDDDRLIEECNRWHLSRYEVCEPPKDSKYQAVVILYYEAAAVLAIAG